MSDELAESHPPLPVPGTARHVAHTFQKRSRAFMVGPLIASAVVAVKATIHWGWLGAAGSLGLGVIVIGASATTRKHAAIRLRAAFNEPAGFAVEFKPLDPGDYKRLGAALWRERTFRALLVIDDTRLTFLPDAKAALLYDREEFSVPMADVRDIVVHRPLGLRPGAMAFVELEGGDTLHFHVLDRGTAFADVVLSRS